MRTLEKEKTVIAELGESQPRIFVSLLMMEIQIWSFDL
jgi:hypothetical protein